MHTKHLLIGALLGLSLQTACGDDSASPDGAGSGGRSSSAGTGAIGGAGDLTALASAGTIADAINMATALAECNPDAVSVTECGGTACPALPETAAASCTINCCSPDDKCGQRSALRVIEQSLGTECAATPMPDARCPSTMLLGNMLVGCCDASGQCGQIIGTLCISDGTRACDAVAIDAGI